MPDVCKVQELTLNSATLFDECISLMMLLNQLEPGQFFIKIFSSSYFLQKLKQKKAGFEKSLL